MNLTVIYYTANLEHSKFAHRIRQKLTETIGKLPLISVSQKPLDFGQNICIGEIGRSFKSVYLQILAGCKAAKTDYVAMAEDDTLYPEIHFDEHYFQPLDTFNYNFNRWSIPTWVKPPMYVITQRLCNSNMIAPRKLLIELIEKRIRIDKGQSKLWSEPGKHDAEYGLTGYKTHFFSTTPVVSFIHQEALGFKFLGKRKKISPMRAFDIPYWGHVNNWMKLYEGN